MAKTTSKERILFVCTGNAARSQMAEGLMRHHYGERFEVHSAGMYPGKLLDAAVAAMGEVGIDISGHEVKSVERYYRQAEIFDYVATVCANAAAICPSFPGTQEVVSWHFDDPAEPREYEAQLRVARQTRDAILDALHDLVSGLKPPAPQERSLLRGLLRRF